MIAAMCDKIDEYFVESVMFWSRNRDANMRFLNAFHGCWNAMCVCDIQRNVVLL